MRGERRTTAALGAALLLLLLEPSAGSAGRQDAQDGVADALAGHYAALEKQDFEAAGEWLAPGYFYIAPWGALELPGEMLDRYREAFSSGRLKNYRVQIRDLRSGEAGEDARWFRAIVRETYLRESGRRARNSFAENLLTSGVAVREGGRWKIRFLQQTWSQETLRQMIPILHAAQPVDPEEY